MRILLALILVISALACAERSATQAPAQPPSKESNAIEQAHLKLYLKLQTVREWMDSPDSEWIETLGLKLENQMNQLMSWNHCRKNQSDLFSQAHGLWANLNAKIFGESAGRCPVEAKISLTPKVKRSIHRNFYEIPSEVSFKIQSTSQVPSYFLKEIHLSGQSTVDIENLSTISGKSSSTEFFVGYLRDKNLVAMVQMESQGKLEWNREQVRESTLTRDWQFTTNNSVTRIREVIQLKPESGYKKAGHLYINDRPIHKEILDDIKLGL